MLSLSLLALSLAPFILAQSTDETIQIEAAKAHIDSSAIVPDMLSSFDPSAVVSINFDGVGDINPGQALSKDQAAPTPAVSVTPANSTVDLSSKYTLFMLDADIVGADDSEGFTRHWLVNGVSIVDNRVAFDEAVTVTDYAGPGPAAGSGAHRYVILLYTQPDSFIPPADFQSGAGVAKMSLETYIQDSGLGPLVGASYFTVEEGTATVSVSATSEVVTSTLASADPTSGTTSGSSTPSASGSEPTSETPDSTDNNNGASKVQGTFLTFAVAGLVLTILV